MSLSQMKAHRWLLAMLPKMQIAHLKEMAVWTETEEPVAEDVQSEPETEFTSYFVYRFLQRRFWMKNP